MTVGKISSFQVEATSREQANELADDLLGTGGTGGAVGDTIDQNDSGWEVTDVEESD